MRFPLLLSICYAHLHAHFREWDRNKPALSLPVTSSKEGGVKDLRELLQRRKSGAEADSPPPKQDNPVTEKPADTVSR